MELLVPCAGRSSRFQTEMPKYLLKMPDGRPMFEFTCAPFLEKFDRVCFAILREHDELFGAEEMIRQRIPQAEVTVISQVTRGQAETVELMRARFDTREAFLVKDCDSYFVPIHDYDPKENSVSVCHAESTPSATLGNKSYVELDNQNRIIRIVEKQVISKWFSCGGYFFSAPEQFSKAYAQLDLAAGECFISHVIAEMLQQGAMFRPTECSDFADFGTQEDWIREQERFRVY